MRRMLLIILILLFAASLAFLIFCTRKDTLYTPGEELGITTQAYVCDTSDVDTSLQLSQFWSASAVAETVFAGIPLTFIGFVSSDSGIASMQWTMGDGKVFSGRVVQYEYDSAGTYHPTFTITDSSGFTVSKSVFVLIKPVTNAAARGYVRFQGKTRHDSILVTMKSSTGLTQTVITNALGYYEFRAMIPDTYNVLFHAGAGRQYKDSSLYNVFLADRRITFVNAMELMDVYDPSIVAVSPSGVVTSRHPAVSGSLCDSGSGIAPEAFRLIFNGVAISSDSMDRSPGGFSYIPLKLLVDGVYTVNATVQDSAGNKDSISWTFTVDAKSFSRLNDTTVSINDTIHLHGQADSLDYPIVKYEWSIGTGGAFKPAKQDTSIIAPSIADSNYQCVLKVTDSIGKVKLDTASVVVLLDEPIVNAGRDTVLNMNARYTLHGTASKRFGTIVKWEWKFGGMGGFVQTSSGDTTITTPGTDMADYACILSVIDNDGNHAVSSVHLTLGIWEKVGVNGFFAGEAGSISLAADNGIPYVAYQDWSGGATKQITVMKNDGTGWGSVGLPRFSATDASSIDLVFSLGAPYVAFFCDSGAQILAMKYDGTAWSYLGSAALATGNISEISMAVDNGVPFVAHMDTTNNKLAVMKYDGSSWATVGASGFTPGGAANISLSVSGGTPYIAFRDEVHGGQTSVMKFNGAAWANVGSAGISSVHVSDNSLVVAEGIPYVVYVNTSGPHLINGRKFNGSIWAEFVSNSYVPTAAHDDISLAVMNGVPYVAYADSLNGAKASVAKFDGDKWAPVGPKTISDGIVYFPELSVSNGRLFLAYKDVTGGNNVYVWQLR